jgi:hypothetical protein
MQLRMSQSCLKFDYSGSRLTIPSLEIVLKYINRAEGLLCPDGHFCVSLTTWHVYCALCLISGLWFRVVTKGQVILSRGLSASLYGSSRISCVIANCRYHHHYNHDHHHCYLNCQTFGDFLSCTTLRFFHAFSSVVRQMPGYNSQRRGAARTSQFTSQFFFFSIVMCAPFSVFCVLFVCKCVLYCCHRVSTKLQLNNNNNNSNNNHNNIGN